MCESMHPYYYSCPLAYLDAVPVACEEWRQLVLQYHAKQARRLTVGVTYALIGRSVPHVRIVSLRPLRGTYMGWTYRVSKTYVGEAIPNSDANGSAAQAVPAEGGAACPRI